MTQTLNSLGQPVGLDIAGWTPPQRPPRESMVGLYCRVEPLDKSRHAADLYRAKITREKVVGAKGFEPSTSWSRTRRASQAALRPDDLQQFRTVSLRGSLE